MKPTTIPLFALFFIGCGEPTNNPIIGTQIGDEGSFGCTILSTTPVADPDAPIAELGRSANEAQDGLLGDFAGTATLNDGSTLDPFALTLAPATAMDWVETALPDGTPSSDCTPYLRLTLMANLDGGTALTASIPTEVAISATTNLLKGSVDMGVITTTIDPLWVTPSDMDWTDLVLLGFFTEGRWTGSSGFMGCTTDGPCSPPISADGTDVELAFDVGP